MLTLHQIQVWIRRPALVVALLVGMVGSQVGAQHSVAILTGTTAAADRSPAAVEKSLVGSESFKLVRNLITFEAEVDGRPGLYVLDTGAPSLILNNRGEQSAGASRTALGSGGTVNLTDHRVQQFVMGDRSIRNYWAMSLDLRSFESRTDQRIDGFAGYDLVNQGELRIDYARGEFSVLKSRRRPLHAGFSPLTTLRFQLDGHLPVVDIQIGDKNYRFIVDTGAGANLIDPSVLEVGLISPTGRKMNIQGLDGLPADHAIVRLDSESLLARTELVAIDLHHLQHDPLVPIAGILGSAFLGKYAVGIDYRRRKIHLWDTAKQPAR